MYLSSVEIHNFRSLESLQVNLEPGLNVLVGRNNTGKTNLLQAIRHAVGPSAARGDPLWLDRDDFYRKSRTDDPAATMSVALTFSNLSESERAHYFEVVDFDLADLSKSKAVIRFEATWPKGKRMPTIKRTGGPQMAESPEIPTDLLASLPITFLPAVRNAEASLAPGQRSRLALLLQDLDERLGGSSQKEIKSVFTEANLRLETDGTIKAVRQSLQKTTSELAGTDYSPSAIRATEADFERILRTLQVQMDNEPIASLSANGLGYNNILYMAVVLEHLRASGPDESQLLLVEEPEAHLHPQLAMLLADYLANKSPGASKPQTIITTHSPTLAATVKPSQIRILFVDPEAKKPRCTSIARAGLTGDEEHELQRMMDITRATLYFAKAAILVEGISEALLLPVLARRMGHDFAHLHISVVPICGVAFGTFRKLLDPAVLGIPVAVVTDGDPPVTRGANWETDTPEEHNGAFKVSCRAENLVEVFAGRPAVCLQRSHVTLEYDLAAAGLNNANLMAEVWESCFQRTPRTLNKLMVSAAGEDSPARALCVWRGICRADHSGSKAEFAHRLAARLQCGISDGDRADYFVIPQYIREAIDFVTKRVPAPQDTAVVQPL